LDLFPSILINNRTFLGSWKSENVLEAVCSGFKKDIPEACYTEGVFKKVEKGLGFGFVLFIIIIIVIINAVIFVVCRRYIMKRINDRVESNDLNSQINSVVNRYMAMRETKL